MRNVTEDVAKLLARPIAHRGLHACGAMGAVENSLSAARAAIDRGYGIECDVQLSGDGEAMVFHDDTLERLTGMRARLTDLDSDEIRRLPIGGGPDRVPALRNLLQVIAGRVPLVVEIKSLGNGDMRLADRTLALLEDYPGPVFLESFDPAIISYCQALKLHRPIGLVGSAQTDLEDDLETLAACDFLSWSIDDVVRIAHSHPTLPRTAWTVRTLAQAALAARYDTQIVFEGFTP